MAGICYIVIALLIAVIILSFLGRLEYNLSYGGENYPQAIYAENSHDYSTRFLTISNSDNLHIRAHSENGQIQLFSYIAIVIMYLTGIVPLIVAYFFLAKVFSNVSNGYIFVQNNAHYLLYYGLIQVALAVLHPFVKLLIAYIANFFVSDTISIATGTDMLNNLIPAMGFLIAAYIISYGVNLKDEVDHTI